jgi:hypothetical protein
MKKTKFNKMGFWGFGVLGFWGFGVLEGGLLVAEDQVVVGN